MAIKLIDFSFGNAHVANPDGSFAATVENVTATAGPGATPAGHYPTAVDLGPSGRVSADITGLAVDFQRFTVRVVFQAHHAGGGRQNLVESNLLPFALFLTGREGSTALDLVASVAPKAHGWRAASTQFATGLQAKTWYTADLVYDLDTVGLFIDGQVIAVHAFPHGEIEPFSGTGLFLGTWVDGARDHFDGQLAGLQWYAGIPESLEVQLDERRSSPEWFVTHKLETVLPQVDLGAPTTPLTYDPPTDAYLQHYERGALMYQDGMGAAFEMHGAIYALYSTLSDPAAIGYLVSDEVDTTRPGGRKSVFSGGAIYWSPDTGAVPVSGQIYLDYEALGESRAIGFPTQPARTVPEGTEQEFQGARMYFKHGDTNAHEVHGAILAKYLALGGVSVWGFPFTNETDVKKNRAVVGKFSEFEACTIYWSPRTGACETHGHIRQKYLDLGGPAGELGFPTSDEAAIPGVSGPGRYNTFQQGSLLWYGSWESMIVARPFKLFLGRINTDESEGFTMGQNDLYIKVTVKDGATVVYDQKHPPRGTWGGQNIVDVNLTIPVLITPNTGKVITLIVDVWESDGGAPFGGGNDHLGVWTKQLTAANGWGLRENGGILDSGAFSKINSIKASVKPQVDIASLPETEKFWGVANQGTDDLSYQQYASAFSDVDSDTEWWDTTDWLDRAFYELVVQDLAENGNCFGMALEAIYARKHASLFSLPLSRFTDWNVVRPEVNVKHCYQVGAGPIWWFLKEFITGNTHDPKDVFTRTRAEFYRGNHPVLCVSQKSDFSGAPHCILPVAWDSSTHPWKMTVCDPNFPKQLKTLTVNPDNNTFEYQGSHLYQGGAWSGGRLHFMPFSLLDARPRTPIWDAILLILGGTILILGTDAETANITDPEGNDLDGFGDRATAQLQAGGSLNGYFVGFKGFDRSQGRKGSVAGELLVRMRPPYPEAVRGPAAVPPSVVAHLPVGSWSATRELRALRQALAGTLAQPSQLSNRTLHHIANDTRAMQELDEATRERVTNAFRATRPGDFRHAVVGVRDGQFHYAIKHSLHQYQLGSTVASSERTEVAAKDMGTSKSMLRVTPDRDKLLTLEVDQKLGVAGDRMKVRVDSIPMAGYQDLQVNLKPGLGGIEIIPAPEHVSAQVQVEAVVGGARIRRRFELPIEGGARLKLSTILTDNALGVSRIDRLFGPARGFQLIRGRG
jgi:LGFP repeat